MAPGSGVFELKTWGHGIRGNTGFPPAIMANGMSPVWSNHDAETGRIAGNTLLNRVDHQVQEIPSADFQSGEAPATETGLEGLGAAVNYRARGHNGAGLAVEVAYEPQYAVTAAGMQVP